jgi:SAM-dependent methyltransferase
MTDEAVPAVIDVYQRHSAASASLRQLSLTAECGWLERFCSLIPIGGSILDIGCSSGIPIGRELLRRGFALFGVEATPAMAALFRQNLPGTPIFEMDMRALHLSRPFDGLLAWDSLFHLSPIDQRRMFARFSTHAESGAPLIFTSGDKEGEVIGELEGTPLYHGSLSPNEYRTLLEAANFEIVAHVSTDPLCGNRTIWLARKR